HAACSAQQFCAEQVVQSSEGSASEPQSIIPVPVVVVVALGPEPVVEPVVACVPVVVTRPPVVPPPPLPPAPSLSVVPEVPPLLHAVSAAIEKTTAPNAQDFMILTSKRDFKQRFILCGDHRLSHGDHALPCAARFSPSGARYAGPQVFSAGGTGLPFRPP